MTPGQEFADRVLTTFLLRTVDIQRHEKFWLAELTGLADSEIRKALRKAVASSNVFEAVRVRDKRKATRDLASEATGIVAEFYEQIGPLIFDSAVALGVDEANNAADDLTWLLDARPRLINRIDSDDLVASLNDLLFMGMTFSEVIDFLSTNAVTRTGAEMLASVRNADSIQETNERVLGVYSRVARDVAAMSAIMLFAAVNSARGLLFQQNDHVIRALMSVAVIDSRTTELCISRDRAAWDAKTLKPLPDSPRKEPWPGYPPWHYFCRSTIIPVIRAYSDLSGVGDAAKGSNGSFPTKHRYESWLETLSAAQARGVLGAGRYELWKDGKLNFSELVDQSGRRLTLDQLREAAERRRNGG